MSALLFSSRKINVIACCITRLLNKNKYYAVDSADTTAADDGTDTTAEDDTEVDTDDDTDADTDDTDATTAATDDTTTTGTVYDSLNSEYKIQWDI